MSNDIIINLKANYKFLTKTEQKIAKNILENPKEFINLSMNELSEKADVSQGSIINFSNKFSGGGFRDLKLKVAEYIGNNKIDGAHVVQGNNTIKSVLENTISGYNSAFSITAEVNNEKLLKTVAQKIVKAKKVEIYGVYRSAAVATDLCYGLLEIGIPSTFVSDILSCSMSASMLDKNSVVVAISSSGKTKDIIDAVKNAGANGVTIVSITSNINSPLAKLSDYVLVASPSTNNTLAIEKDIRASQLLLTDTLCSYIKATNKFVNKKQYDVLKNILNSHSIEEVENEK